MSAAVGPTGEGFGDLRAPLPPNRLKARAHREASCPRHVREIFIRGFGEGEDSPDLMTRASLQAQLDPMFAALHPMVGSEFPTVSKFEVDLDSKSLRYRLYVANDYAAARVVKRLNGFSIHDEDDPFVGLLRQAFTQKDWTALLNSLEGTVLKVTEGGRRDTLADRGDRQYARFGLGTYLYFYALKRLAGAFALMALVALPAVFLSFWDNRAAKGCPESLLACAIYGTAGNIPTASQANASEPISEFISRSDRNLLFGLADFFYTAIFIFALFRLKRAENAEINGDGGGNEEDLTTAADYTVQVSKIPPGVDAQKIRDFFEVRFGPVVEVSVALRSSQLLKAYSKLGRQTSRLQIAQAKAKGKPNKKLLKLNASVEMLTAEIGDLTAGGAESAEQQSIVCAFVTFDRYEDTQKCLRLYSGFFTGWLCLDHRFRWKESTEVPGQPAPPSEIVGGLCDTKKWGKRLRVERAPDPANILWESFGHSEASLCCRSVASAVTSLLLVSLTISAFLVSEYYRGMPGTEVCDTVVCDARLWEVHPWALVGIAAPPGGQFFNATEYMGGAFDVGATLRGSYGVSCASSAPADGITATQTATDVVFRIALTNRQGYPSCVRAYDFCAGLTDEVRVDIEAEVCEEHYLHVRQHSNALWEYLPWITLVAVNILMRWLVPKLGECEQHTSKAQRAVAIAQKLFVAQLINTVLTLWAVHFAGDLDLLSSFRTQHRLPGEDSLTAVVSETDELFGGRWYRETGAGMSLALLLNGVLPKLAIITRACVDRCCRARCCSCCAVTQEQLNERFSGQLLNLPLRYACMWTTVFSCLLYSAGMPVLVLIGAIDICLLYASEKYFLFHYYSKPPQYDEQLAVASSKLLPLAALSHLVMSIWMYSNEAVFGDWVITEEQYGKTRRYGINATVVDEGYSGLMDEWSDVATRRHIKPVVLFCLGLFCALLGCACISPEALLRPCRRWKFCRFRILPPRAYRTYTESVGEIRLGGLESYEIRNNPGVIPSASRGLKLGV